MLDLVKINMMSKKEINSLVVMLQKLQAGKQKKKSKPKQRNIPAAMAVEMSVGAGKKKGKRSKMDSIGDGGSIRIRRREFFVSIEVAAGATYVRNSVQLTPSDTALPFLNGMYKMYEYYEVHSMVIEYVPAVGTSSSGLVIFGYDGSGDNQSPSDRGVVGMLQPVSDGALWLARKFRLTKERLMSRKRYAVKASGTQGENPGSIKLYATSSPGSVGELWISYDITLSSPHKA